MFELQHVIGAAGVAAIAYAIGYVLLKIDDRIEARRDAAIDLSAGLAELGFQRLPKLLRKYAVGDYDGIAGQIVDAARLMQSPDGVATLLVEAKAVTAKTVERMVKTPEGTAELRTLLDAAQGRRAATSGGNGVTPLSATLSG